VWDLKEFEMVRTDEDRLSTQRSMLSMNQLRDNMDSLRRVVQEGKQNIANDLVFNLNRQPAQPRTAPVPDSLRQIGAVQKLTKKKTLSAAKNNISRPTPTPQQAPNRPKLPQQELGKPLSQYAFYYETFRPEDRPGLLREAHTRALAGVTALETRKAQIEARRMDYIKTGYELYIKYSFALVCFIFLFIGAPMGAIIRKGGFGYPILVSIIFFVTFIMLTILCRKLAEGDIMTSFWAAMVPCLVLIPIGAFLTRKAMNDSQMFSTDRLDRFMRWLRNRYQKQKPAVAA